LTLPTFSTKTKVITSVLVVATAFASGRYSVTITPEVKTIIDQKIADHTKTDTDTHTQTKIVEVKTPDGTDTKTTTISQVKEVQAEDAKQVQTHVDQTVTPIVKPKMNLSVMVGTQVINPNGQPLYGASFDREFIGPVTLGIWALNNGTIGIRAGLDF
jgi:hypothetical protein